MAPINRLRKSRVLKKLGSNNYGIEEKEKEKRLDLKDLRQSMIQSFGHSSDFKVVEGKVRNREGIIFYLESMIDSKMMIETTSQFFSRAGEEKIWVDSIEDLDHFCKEAFGGSGCQIHSSLDEMILAMIDGAVVVAISGFDHSISVNMGNNEKRSITEPSTQTVIRGPKDGFIESVLTNISLIRRRIKNPKLRFERFIIGTDTRTSVYMGYVHGIANEAIIQEVRNRLEKINVSAVFESGNIEELISDKTFTLFPLALNTERPDTVASNLMDGKIVIMVDGSPFSLLVPAVFVNFFEISEDYYQPFFLGTFLRFIRYLSFMIALITPSVYVGILTFHHELLPTTLLLSIIAQREGVPFPAVVEVLLMEITFEILREAGVRMPKAVGQMVSIVGALVIGQAAAEAGIISNIMIIIVAITAIANFVSPTYSFAAASRLLRFLLILAASVLGLYGVLIVLIFMVAHLCSLRSFGVPYLSPVAPFILGDQKDVFVRFPFWAMKNRPKYLRAESEIKLGPDSEPSPPPMKGE